MTQAAAGDFIRQFKALRRAGVPLAAVETADPAACVERVLDSYTRPNGGGKPSPPPPAVRWDSIFGYTKLNEAGQRAITVACGTNVAASKHPVNAAEMAAKLPEKTVLFMFNAHHYLAGHKEAPEFCQALYNLRDQFKLDRRTAVLLAPHVKLPPELRHDVVVIEEPLPADEDLAAIVETAHRDAADEGVPRVEKLPPEYLPQRVDALRGLSAFAAEQAVAMCLTEEGVDRAALQERKHKVVEETDGLTIQRARTTFADIYGIEAAKQLARQVIGGRETYRVFVFVDEIEKSGIVAGAQESSGTSKDQLNVLLTEMQNKRHNGLMCVGPPGAAKSVFAKAFGNEAGYPTIALDLGAAKGGIVGESERKIREALKIIDSIGGGKAFWLATSNDISAVRPELLRRFKEGVMFFDLPDAEERQGIWRLYLDKYEMDAAQVGVWSEIDDTDWTGAEIEKCVFSAWNKRITLAEAARWVIPVARTNSQMIEGLRNEAEGRWLSAQRVGAYSRVEPDLPAPGMPAKRRKVEVGRD
jgi:hypothetical protein